MAVLLFYAVLFFLKQSVFYRLYMVGKVKVLFHRQRKPVQLELDVAGNVRLKNTMSRADFRHLLTLTYPCAKCGGQMEFYDDAQEINCPHCGMLLMYRKMMRSKSNPSTTRSSNIFILLLRAPCNISTNTVFLKILRHLLLLFQEPQCQNTFLYCHRHPSFVLELYQIGISEYSTITAK